MARPRTRTDSEVLAAALRAVASRGVARLTLADVAREAGLAPSTLAERFGSKRALLLAAARHAAGEVRVDRRGEAAAEGGVPAGGEAAAEGGVPAGGEAAAEGGVPAGGEVAAERSAGSPLAAAVDGLVGLARGVGDRRAFAHSLALLELDVADAGFRAAAAGHFGAIHDQLAALLREALAAGELVPDADPDALARALHVAYNGALVLWAVTGDTPLEPSLRADLEAVLVRSRSPGPGGRAA
jgi:AcrR family transcriptional regulator